jgi:hypothetical protein
LPPDEVSSLQVTVILLDLLLDDDDFDGGTGRPLDCIRYGCSRDLLRLTVGLDGEQFFLVLLRDENQRKMSRNVDPDFEVFLAVTDLPSSAAPIPRVTTLIFAHCSSIDMRSSIIMSGGKQ